MYYYAKKPPFLPKKKQLRNFYTPHNFSEKKTATIDFAKSTNDFVKQTYFLSVKMIDSQGG